MVPVRTGGDWPGDCIGIATVHSPLQITERAERSRCAYNCAAHTHTAPPDATHHSAHTEPNVHPAFHTEEIPTCTQKEIARSRAE